jgi:hypothetical protein
MRSCFAANVAGLAMRRAALVLLSICFAAAALAQEPATPDAPAPPAKPADNGKCIGVLSAIGDSFSLQKIGITAFGNERDKVAIDSWQIDNLVVGKISAFMGKSWSVRPISYPKGTFATLEQDHGLLYDYEAELAGIVRRVTSSTKCTHHVVVLKTSSRYGTSNQSIYGLGILEVGAPLHPWDHIDYLHALYVIRVYDGRTFAKLGERRGSFDEWHFSDIQGPYRQVDNASWPRPGAAPGAAVREGLRSLVAKSLDVTMPQVLRVQ